MAIQVIRAEEREKWDSIVRSFSNYDVYYLSGYAKAFQIHGDGEPLLFHYEGDDLRGINVVMKRDVAKDAHFAGKLPEDTYFDFSTPYGYGGWLTEGEGDPEPLFEEYEHWCREHGIISEFVRFELFGDSWRHYPGTVESRTRNVVRSLEMPLDEMWMDFKQKVRKNVKRARSCGVQVVRDEAGERLEDFLRIYYGTMERNSASDGYYFSRAFFETIQRMRGNFMYFYALHEGRAVSAELVLCGAENCYSYLGGTDSASFDLRPNDLLKYEIICWAKERGMRNFVLGGGYGADDGIFQYKACLAPHGIVDFHIGRRIFDSEKYGELCALRGIEPNTRAFFPEYRSE